MSLTQQEINAHSVTAMVHVVTKQNGVVTVTGQRSIQLPPVLETAQQNQAPVKRQNQAPVRRQNQAPVQRQNQAQVDGQMLESASGCSCSCGSGPYEADPVSSNALAPAKSYSSRVMW